MTKHVLLSEALEDARPPAFSDEALALRFADRHADDLRFVALWNKWLVWCGSHWRFDETLHAFDRARHVCREAAAECNEAKAAAIASARTRAAVEGLARSDRRLAATVDQWDADPWRLNTPQSVIDLRTGSNQPHSPGDYATKITAVGPGGGCPRFLAFLARITGGDAELVSYLQRVLGYALTGITREHALFFAHGTGANGKSVLLSTVAGILGDYHRTAPIETFVAGNGERHPTDLAGLRGARLVTATETEEGRRWAEAKIKQLTGGDVISARFMRQDFFDYRPAFKLVIAGNHRPSLRSVDEAIRRRFHLIPFSVTIPAEERDAELVGEAQGRMAWYPAVANRGLHTMADGKACGRLRPCVTRPRPICPRKNSLTAWIDEKCQRAASDWAALSTLFRSWSSWADASGEVPGAMKTFAQALEARGFVRHKRKTGQGFYGLRLKLDEAPPPHWQDER